MKIKALIRFHFASTVSDLLWAAEQVTIVYNVKKNLVIMKLTPAPDAPSSSWESLRRQADLLGIPAWKLAEDNARHTDSEKLTFLDRVNKQ